MRKANVDANRLRAMIEAETLTQRRAAELLGVSISTVERLCRRLGLATQRTGPRSGDGHPNWSGGRILVGGYWYVWAPDHPAATKQHRVAEHRLVMERILGRFLGRDEVVHHRNADTQDNRPENLEVFRSNPDHLRHELTGRVPRWTDDGRSRIAAGVQRSAILRKQKAADAHLQRQDARRLTD